jgi:hypothetical protein
MSRRRSPPGLVIYWHKGSASAETDISSLFPVWYAVQPGSHIAYPCKDWRRIPGGATTHSCRTPELPYF